MAAATAYTSVAARRNLAQTENTNGAYSSSPSLSSTQTIQQTPPPTRKVEWPSPVRDYVFRSFQEVNLIPGIDRNEMQVKLKKTLSDAAEALQLEHIDWATLPLPQQLIQQERAVGAWHTSASKDNAWIPITNNDSASKKRKLGAEADAADHASTPTPPWEQSNDANGFEARISYASKTQKSKMEKRVKKQQEVLGKGTSKFHDQAEKRKQRFGAQLEDPPSPPWGKRQRTPEPEVPVGPVVGTCEKLEKQYFRLNGAPKPEEVRSLDVLKKACIHVVEKWKKDGNYAYTCDQFKSLRQDLTVQHIKNDFTVKVYEIHARIALEMGDLGEYNQCQTQLRALYSLKLGGNPAEFLAYRILYFVHTCNRTGLNDILADITPELKQAEAVKHALAVRSAQASGNYHKLLARLYQSVPNMGAYLMDMFVARERLAALAVICKSYKPNVSIQFLAEELGFDSYESAIEFLDQAGIEPTGLLSRPADQEPGTWRLDAAKAAPLFEVARARAFKTVDIKGQI